MVTDGSSKELVMERTLIMSRMDGQVYTNKQLKNTIFRKSLAWDVLAVTNMDPLFANVLNTTTGDGGVERLHTEQYLQKCFSSQYKS